MLLLGLLLICATGAFTGLLIADNLSGGPDYQVSVLGNTIATMNTLEIFLSGLALALLFCLGLAMSGIGGTLARRRRLALKDARSHLGRHSRTARPAPATPDDSGEVEPARSFEREFERTSDRSSERTDGGSVASPTRTQRRPHLFGH